MIGRVLVLVRLTLLLWGGLILLLVLCCAEFRF